MLSGFFVCQSELLSIAFIVVFDLNIREPAPSTRCRMTFLSRISLTVTIASPYWLSVYFFPEWQRFQKTVLGKFGILTVSAEQFYNLYSAGVVGKV